VRGSNATTHYTRSIVKATTLRPSHVTNHEPAKPVVQGMPPSRRYKQLVECGVMEVLETELGQASMIRRARTLGPEEQPVRLTDRNVADTRLAPPHQSLAVKLPLLVAVRAFPPSRRSY
jgi:hypothetical protein